MNSLNAVIFGWLHQFAGKNFILDEAGIFFSQYLPYLLVLGFLIYALKQKKWRLRFLIIADGVLAIILARGIITEVFRFFYNHPRPFEVLNFAPLIGESGSSFPSGHATFFFALAIVAIYYSRELGWWYLAFAVLNGIARVYAGVHWPLDILGGAAIGILCGIASHALIKPIFEKISKPPIQQKETG